ncbi:MAG: hypothetical protein JZU49_00360 [Sulfuricurvum sp.]|nr:hypothetical protein [Sulfuricurvum sp.]
MTIFEIGSGGDRLHITLNNAECSITGNPDLVAGVTKTIDDLFRNNVKGPEYGFPEVIVAEELIRLMGGRIIQYPKINPTVVY